MQEEDNSQDSSSEMPQQPTQSTAHFKMEPIELHEVSCDDPDDSQEHDVTGFESQGDETEDYHLMESESKPIPGTSSDALGDGQGM